MKTNKERIKNTLEFYKKNLDKYSDTKKDLFDDLQVGLKEGNGILEIESIFKELVIVQAKIDVTIQIKADLEAIIDLWID